MNTGNCPKPLKDWSDSKSGQETHVCYINIHTDEYVSIKVSSLYVDRMIKDLEDQGSLVSMFSDKYWKGDEWTEGYLRNQLK